MAVTGLALWFKLYATRLVPRWVLGVFTTVHFFEAILATLAIFVWHFYFVIFDPDVYPVNWAWLDGKITPHQHLEEHGLDTDAEGLPGHAEPPAQDADEPVD